ncbi:MAG: hypothetical protein O3C40_10815 [Planctomycetota bacterium]|nr:hypothetical protein [Planctomycetota bacterium]
MNRTLGIGCLLLTLFVASGATCHHRTFGVDPMAPAAFTTPPTLDEIIYAVNANTNRVQQLHSDSAWLSLPGLPGLRTTVSLERERRFRLKSKLIGPELDIGSNDELFWFWAKQSPEPVVFYASHRDFAASPARGMFPVDPHWLIEAIGLVQLEPGGMHEGPFTREDGRVEVRTRLPGPTGDMTRVLVIDGRYGWILEQHLFDAAGRAVASARTSGHRYYAAAAVSLPHRIEIEMPDAQLSLTIDVSEYSINSLYGSPEELWGMPRFEGFTPVNIAAPQYAPPASPMTSSRQSFPSTGPPSRLTQRPAYRGYSTVQ